jgi:hypothetical protein
LAAAESELTDLRKASSSTGDAPWPAGARGRLGSAAGFGTKRGADTALEPDAGTASGITGSVGRVELAAADTSGVGSGSIWMFGAAVAAASAEGEASGAEGGVLTNVAAGADAGRDVDAAGAEPAAGGRSAIRP